MKKSGNHWDNLLKLLCFGKLPKNISYTLLYFFSLSTVAMDLVFPVHMYVKLLTQATAPVVCHLVATQRPTEEKNRVSRNYF